MTLTPAPPRIWIVLVPGWFGGDSRGWEPSPGMHGCGRFNTGRAALNAARRDAALDPEGYETFSLKKLRPMCR